MKKNDIINANIKDVLVFLKLLKYIEDKDIFKIIKKRKNINIEKLIKFLIYICKKAFSNGTKNTSILE